MLCSSIVASCTSTLLTVSHQDIVVRCRATLVVCPVTLMGQWATELADKTNGRLKVLMHHGVKRSRDPKDLLEHDVVLVTYQTIAQEWGYLQHSQDDRADMTQNYPIARIKWHRLELDEAHTAKNPNAGFTKVCAELASDNR